MSTPLKGAKKKKKERRKVYIVRRHSESLQAETAREPTKTSCASWHVKYSSQNVEESIEVGQGNAERIVCLAKFEDELSKSRQPAQCFACGPEVCLECRTCILDKRQLAKAV